MNKAQGIQGEGDCGGHEQTRNLSSQSLGAYSSDLRETICILFMLPLLHRDTTYESALGGLLSFKTTVTLLLTVDPSDKKMMD